MSYVVYDRTLQRTGFRPKTNPYGAAHGLSGLGAQSSRVNSSRSLAPPARYQYPFTARGGWGLHGMGQGSPGIPPGAYISYSGNFVTTSTMTAQDIVNAIAGASLSGLSVVSVSSNAGILANTSLLGIGEAGQQFSVSIVLQVTGPGFAQASDAASIVNNAYYNATGVMPLGSSASVTAAGAGGGPPSPAATDLTTWLEQNAIWIGLGIAAVVVLPKLL